MRKIHKEKTLDIPFCGGRLCIWIRRWNRKYYYTPLPNGTSPEESNVRLSWVIFAYDNQEIEIETLEELFALTEDRDCSLEQEVKGAPSEFAIIFGELLDISRVITLAPLYEPLEKHFDIKVEERLPSVHDHTLYFLIVRHPLGGESTLTEVTINLRDGTVTQTSIPPRKLQPVSNKDDL